VTRWVSTANEAAAELEHASLRLAVELDFVSGMVRAHDGLGTISFLGNDYVGVGRFGGIDEIVEELETIARGARLTLSAEDPALLAPFNGEVYQGRPATIYVVMVSPNTGQVIDTPQVIWQGDMDVLTYFAEDGSSWLELTCEDELARLLVVSRYTNEEQQRANPGDRFFERLPRRQGFIQQWGAVTIITGGGFANNQTPAGPGNRLQRF
jgi:hypothetical protein